MSFRCRVLAVLLVVVAANDASASESIRCAFDIGSGETKVTAGVVEGVGENASVRVLEAKRTPLPIKSAVQGGVLPEEVIEELIVKIEEFKIYCKSLGASEFSGVATSGFRAATVNGKSALARVSKKTEVPMRIISGDEEAALGLLVAISRFPNHRGPKVAWDIGGGSLQFAAKVSRPDGRNTARVISLEAGAASFNEAVRKKLNRANGQKTAPLTRDEMQEAVALSKDFGKRIPAEIKEAITSDMALVVGLGGTHLESIALATGLNKDVSGGFYDLASVRRAREELIGRDESWVRENYSSNKYPENQTTNFALVSGLMEALMISRVYPVSVNLSEALLYDASAWNVCQPGSTK